MNIELNKLIIDNYRLGKKNKQLKTKKIKFINLSSTQFEL